MSEPTATVLIHEFEASTGRHRLIVIRNQAPQTSGWCKENEFGLFKGYYFQTGVVQSLPEVFRATADAHEVLR